MWRKCGSHNLVNKPEYEQKWHHSNRVWCSLVQPCSELLLLLSVSSWRCLWKELQQQNQERGVASAPLLRTDVPFWRCFSLYMEISRLLNGRYMNTDYAYHPLSIHTIQYRLNGDWEYSWKYKGFNDVQKCMIANIHSVSSRCYRLYDPFRRLIWIVSGYSKITFVCD